MDTVMAGRAPNSFLFDQSRWGVVANSMKCIPSRRNALLARRSLERRSSSVLQCNSAPTDTSSTKNAKADSQISPVVVIDNYDSFTYNLCQYLGDLGCHYEVFRNDEISIDELERRKPRGILISPGPGTPDDSGISLDVVRYLGPRFPLFGVCMGLQCMGQAFGGKIIRAPGGVMHGKTSDVFHNQVEGDGLLGGLPSPFTACRYHSLVIDKESFPDDLEITAWTADGLVMGVRHKVHRHIEGVQFHPESIITQNGKKIVSNFVDSLEKYVIV